MIPVAAISMSFVTSLRRYLSRQRFSVSAAVAGTVGLPPADHYYYGSSLGAVRGGALVAENTRAGRKTLKHVKRHLMLFAGTAWGAGDRAFAVHLPSNSTTASVDAI